MDWLNFFRITGYIALVFGAICTIGVDYLKNRQDNKRDELKDKQMTELMNDVKDSKKLLAPFEDLANQLYPSLNQKEALEKLMQQMKINTEEIEKTKNDLDKTKNDLDKEKNTIKSLAIQVKVKFSGNWNSDKVPYNTNLWNFIKGSYPPISFKSSLMKVSDMNFNWAEGSYKFTPLSNNSALYEVRGTIKVDEFPSGESIEILKKYDQIAVHIPFNDMKNITDTRILMEEFDVSLILNGGIVGTFSEPTNSTFNLRKYEDPNAISYLNFIFAPPPKNKNLYECLNIQS